MHSSSSILRTASLANNVKPTILNHHGNNRQA